MATTTEHHELRLGAALYEQLKIQALSNAPRECCGLVAGLDDHAEAILPLANIAKDQCHEFLIDNADFNEALVRVRAMGLMIQALYHSHPSGDPRLSLGDITKATSGLPILLISMGRGLRMDLFTVVKHQDIRKVYEDQLVIE